MSTIDLISKLKTIKIIWCFLDKTLYPNLRGAQGVVLVYDVTSAKTLVNLDTWLQELNKYESKEADMIKVSTMLPRTKEHFHTLE